MVEVTHRPAGEGWEFSCATVFAVQGRARSLGESVDAAEHSVRQYLSRQGYAVLPQEAHHQTRHLCDGRPVTGPPRNPSDHGHTMDLVL